MDHHIFSQLSDPFPFNSNSITRDSPTLSDACSAPGGSSHSDEEVILASNLPKKPAGRRVFKETRHPVFRGVRRRNGNKWVCEVRVPNKKSRIWLGTYPTPEMAARAHDVAALALRGKSACLNFSDSAWRLPIPSSTSAREIRRIAAEAAESFRPQEFGCPGEQNSSTEDHPSGACCDESKTTVPFMDAEEVFDMPSLLVEMAQGLLLSPLRFEEDVGTDWNGLENDFDISLWSD
ncbi:dehydration-responsive element-binding protein 1E [Ricinus communis]|uniref:Dehydration-responsive element-binding protein 1A, putative n=1 Tax=Ricinus communis TaxID=3988 RepID=B9RC18_RICCO|nr:dehydration-responsive element-binding protein 1E [Ricinus communis]EEF51089.1 Dehydration-responsive element-binding protein 1A, putative [Ricinus communis]|eukprot:XP_002509702.1 dehydration-responsive element-binding protein 1E [Ricinus communis]